MNIVITGTNRGIGLELVKQQLQRGHQIFALCRKASPDLQATTATIIENFDVTEAGNYPKVLEALDGRTIDLLIHNAGQFTNATLENITKEKMLQLFEANSIAPLMLTQFLLPHLSSNAKIAFISSRMGSIGDNQQGSSYAYRASKAALNAIAKSLALDLNRQHPVAILHPGWVKTDMTQFNGQLEAKESARLLSERIDQLNHSNTGHFWHCQGEVLPW